jgi:hypothetical protein
MRTRKAAHKLVTSHLRLVAKIAMGYRGYGLPIGEVISEGNVGLMQAVKKFEPERGFRLATYAMWWIKASIQEYILRSWSLVKMGTTANQKRLFFNLRKVKGKIQALDDGDLKPDQIKEIATKLNVSEEEVVSMNRRLSATPRSMRRSAPTKASPASGRTGWSTTTTARRDADRAGRTGQPPRHAGGRHVGAERSRAPHLRGAPPRRGADDAGGAVVRVRHQPRARAPDRGPRLREGAGRREYPPWRALSAERPRLPRVDLRPETKATP